MGRELRLSVVRADNPVRRADDGGFQTVRYDDDRYPAELGEGVGVACEPGLDPLAESSSTNS
jgi:hypothetical protein